MATGPGAWSSQVAPAPTPARPSSQSRKRQGHIGPLHIWRCPNKVCSGGGSFLLLIWRFRVGAPPPLPNPPPPWFPTGSLTARGSRGRPRGEGARRVDLGARRLRRPPGASWAGEAQARRGGEGKSGRGSTAVILGSPAHLGDRGSEPAERRSGRAGWGRGRPGEAGP